MKSYFQFTFRFTSLLWKNWPQDSAWCWWERGGSKTTSPTSRRKVVTSSSQWARSSSSHLGAATPWRVTTCPTTTPRLRWQVYSKLNWTVKYFRSLKRPAVNFINVLRKAFTLADPESAKRYWWLNCIFSRYWDLWNIEFIIFKVHIQEYKIWTNFKIKTIRRADLVDSEQILDNTKKLQLVQTA